MEQKRLKHYVNERDNVFLIDIICFEYLLIIRNPKNLFTTKENLFELVSEEAGEQTKFMLQPYM